MRQVCNVLMLCSALLASQFFETDANEYPFNDYGTPLNQEHPFAKKRRDDSISSEFTIPDTFSYGVEEWNGNNFYQSRALVQNNRRKRRVFKPRRKRPNRKRHSMGAMKPKRTGSDSKSETSGSAQPGQNTESEKVGEQDSLIFQVDESGTSHPSTVPILMPTSKFTGVFQAGTGTSDQMIPSTITTPRPPTDFIGIFQGDVSDTQHPSTKPTIKPSSEPTGTFQADAVGEEQSTNSSKSGSKSQRSSKSSKSKRHRRSLVAARHSMTSWRASWMIWRVWVSSCSRRRRPMTVLTASLPEVRVMSSVRRKCSKSWA